MRPLLPHYIAAALLCPAFAHAQHATRDSTLANRISADADSIARDKTSPAYTKRAVTRLKANADSLKQNAATLSRDTVRLVDTLKLTVVDTVLVAQQGTPTPAPVPVPPVPAPVSVAFAHPFAAPSNGAILAALPRDTVPVSYPAITRRIPVVNLQQALDTAKAGDALELTPGTAYPPLTVKATARTGWVVIRTAIPDDGNLWTRMTLARADSLNLATIATSDATSPVWFNSAAHHVRFAQVRIVTNFGPLNAIVRATNGETTPDQLAHDVILDRVVVDGRTFDVRRCVYADVIRLAILSSTLENCHSASGDAQATLTANAPGPLRIQNNTLHGSHQGTMFGGVDSRSLAMMPADIVVVGNLIERPPEWTAQGWGEKTLVEQKAALRVLYERNTLRHVHHNGQAGFAWLVKTENQDGSAPWTQSADVTIRYNTVEDAANGFNFAANVGAVAGVNAARITAYGNSVGPFNGTDAGTCVQLLGALSDVVVLHNTCASAGNSVVSLDASTLAPRTVLSGNVFPHGQYGVKGASTTEGTASITKFLPGALFTDNVVFPAQCSLYPAGTLCALPAILPVGADGLAIGADTTRLP